MTQEEKDQLLSFIVASNEKVNELLKKISNQAIKERLTTSLITSAKSLLDTTSPNFDEIMRKLDDKVKAIESIQLEHFDDNSISLEVPRGLKPKESYTFTLAEVMNKQRADIDFFEFDPVIKENANNAINANVELIKLTSNTISGVAPIEEKLYIYKLTLKYVNINEGEKEKLIETDFKLWVGEKPNTDDSSNSPNMLLIIIVVIISIAIIAMIGLQIYLQCYKAKSFKLTEVVDATQYIDARRFEIKSEIETKPSEK